VKDVLKEIFAWFDGTGQYPSEISIKPAGSFTVDLTNTPSTRVLTLMTQGGVINVTSFDGNLNWWAQNGAIDLLGELSARLRDLSGTEIKCVGDGNLKATVIKTFGLDSVEKAITAAGTVYSDAYALTKNISQVTTTASGTGVSLPVPASAGTRCLVINGGANTLKVYPNVGGTIDGGSTNASVNLSAGTVKEYFCIDSLTWYSK